MRRVSLLPLPALLPLLLLAAAPAHAQDAAVAHPAMAPAAPSGPDVLAAIRADRWAEADAAAAALPDPLARKLVLHFRLLAPGAGHADEIAAFLLANPEWPQAPLLVRRLQEALAAAPPDPAALDLCRKLPSGLGVRCPGDPVADARAAWVRGVDGAAEPAFIRQWGRVLTPGDQWARFDRLAWTDTGAPGGPASRQAVRLDAPGQAAAAARLALRRDDPTAPSLFNALPPAAQADPALVLDLARWYRRAGLDRDAAGVWAGAGASAGAAAPPERRAAFWAERNELARRLLRFGDAASAYAVAAGAPQAGPSQTGEAALDQAFLAGWIALRRLNQPDVAMRHFMTLADLSPAAITQARAQYWLGRSKAAADDAEGARAAFEAAARWPFTYYGQLAAGALGDDPAVLAQRIASARDPAWTGAEAAAFEVQEVVRAAALLAAWGDARRAKPFLLRADELASGAGQRALAARFAADLGLPDQAVGIARRAGRDGVVLAETGWPRPVSPPDGTAEPAVVLGLIRQESSFDIAAASPVGARGLMQLMPATAAAVAKRLGVPASVPALTSDPGYNMRLGTAYLQDLLGEFGGVLPLALAGYNAGPHRVRSWLTANGDPVSGGVDMVDWIEMIPFNETRNYVQRVTENIVIYRAQRHEALPLPVAPHSPSAEASAPGPVAPASTIPGADVSGPAPSGGAVPGPMAEHAG